MIICSCKAISDRKVAIIIAESFSYREMILQTQAGTDCGKCTKACKELVIHKKVKPMTNTQCHADTYQVHDLIVRAENALHGAGWKMVNMTQYDPENPLRTDWGVKYMKGESIVMLNRFTAETILNLF
jgi:bacterioferritin-associated ferredoxin